MGRKQPGVPPTPNLRQDNDIITQKREYELITPLFGGGAVPGEADADQPIRGSEIRGQLRFWWRACRGGLSNDDPAKLKEQEDNIWGSAAKVSKENKQKEDSKKQPTVQIMVEILERNKGIAIDAYKPKYNKKENLVAEPVSEVPGYASFPLQPDQDDLKVSRPEDVPLKQVRKGIKFTLTISYHKDRQKDIEAALWAWETFGGIGARTRRGFGALRCISIEEDKKLKALDLMPHNGDQGAWLKSRLQKHVVEGGWPEDVPHLSRKMANGWDFMIINREKSTATSIWDHLINGLRGFRQKRENFGRGVPGKSLWPEADTIRYVTGQRYRPRNKRNTYNGPSPLPDTPKFPRAQLGLPIIFHFKDANPRNPDHKDADPRDTVVVMQDPKIGKDIERLASPLLLKLLACKEGYVGLIAILEGTMVDQDKLILKTMDSDEKRVKSWEVDTYLDEEDKPLNMPTQGRPGTPMFSPKITVDHEKDTLQAFMDYMYERN